MHTATRSLIHSLRNSFTPSCILQIHHPHYHLHASMPHHNLRVHSSPTKKSVFQPPGTSSSMPKQSKPQWPARESLDLPPKQMPGHDGAPCRRFAPPAAEENIAFFWLHQLSELRFPGSFRSISMEIIKRIGVVGKVRLFYQSVCILRTGLEVTVVKSCPKKTSKEDAPTQSKNCNDVRMVFAFIVLASLQTLWHQTNSPEWIGPESARSHLAAL